MKERIVDNEIRLIPYYRNDEVSLPWYQDPDVVKQVDNRDEPYDIDLLHRMYDYLSSQGDCYYIEYKGKLVGDVSLRNNAEIAIVVCKEFQNQHIGRRCVMEMLKLAKEKSMDSVKANIYSFNHQSQKMFESVGFYKTDEEWYQYDFGKMIHLEKINRENWREATFVTTDPERNCPLDEEWVTSAAFSIVQSVYEPEWESRLVMDDDTIIGFVFYGWWAKKNVPLFCRYMIDIKYQGQGYGKAALPVIIKEMMDRYETNKIYLTLEKANERAVHLYTSYGFIPTGEIEEGEEIYVYEKQD